MVIMILLISAMIKHTPQLGMDLQNISSRVPCMHSHSSAWTYCTVWRNATVGWRTVAVCFRRKNYPIVSSIMTTCWEPAGTCFQLELRQLPQPWDMLYWWWSSTLTSKVWKQQQQKNTTEQANIILFFVVVLLFCSSLLWKYLHLIKNVWKTYLQF